MFDAIRSKELDAVHVSAAVYDDVPGGVAVRMTREEFDQMVRRLARVGRSYGYNNASGRQALLNEAVRDGG